MGSESQIKDCESSYPSIGVLVAKVVDIHYFDGPGYDAEVMHSFPPFRLLPSNISFSP
jgi:hypothetical protein